MSGFVVSVDADHGGRWTPLRDPGGREWLWDRPDPARDLVSPGDSFVDVGGLEECYPTIGADPDHGVVWSRPWHEVASEHGSLPHMIQVDGVTLSRTIDARRDCVVANYHLEALPGTRFVWAAHALLELKVGARLEATPGPARAWPGHKSPIDTNWPTPLGIDYAHLGPNDGSALFCLLPDRASVTAHDEGDTLRFRLAARSNRSPSGSGATSADTPGRHRRSTATSVWNPCLDASSTSMPPVKARLRWCRPAAG